MAAIPGNLPMRCFVAISQIDAALMKMPCPRLLLQFAQYRRARRRQKATRGVRVYRAAVACCYSHAANSCADKGSENSGPMRMIPRSAPNRRLVSGGRKGTSLAHMTRVWKRMSATL